MANRSAAPIIGHPSRISAKQLAWIPALMGVAIICGESTNTMGASHTSIWLSHLTSAMGHPNGPVAMLNHLLRKSGHFTGYGLLGLCFARGWHSWLRRRVSATWSGLRLRAGALGVASAFAVATADEVHQIFLPSRGASAWDVLLDTSGALTLNLIMFAFLAMRRDALLNPSAPFTTLGLSFSALPKRISDSRTSLRSGVKRSILKRSARRSSFTRPYSSLWSRGITR